MCIRKRPIGCFLLKESIYSILVILTLFPCHTIQMFSRCGCIFGPAVIRVERTDVIINVNCICGLDLGVQAFDF